MAIPKRKPPPATTENYALECLHVIEMAQRIFEARSYGFTLDEMQALLIISRNFTRQIESVITEKEEGLDILSQDMRREPSGENPRSTAIADCRNASELYCLVRKLRISREEHLSWIEEADTCEPFDVTRANLLRQAARRLDELS